MNRLLTFVTLLWRRRYLIVVSLVAIPALALMYSLNTPPVYKAVQTLAVEPGSAQSPILKQVENPDYLHILQQHLTDSTLARDSLRQVGLLFDGASEQEQHNKIMQLTRHLQLRSTGGNVLEITYTSPDSAQISRVLETVSQNFIDDLVAPERFVTEQEVRNLATQLEGLKQQQATNGEKLAKLKHDLTHQTGKEHAATEKQIAQLEFAQQTLTMQEKLAEKSYEKSLRMATERVAQPIIRPMGLPVIVNPNPGLAQHIRYTICGLLVAFAFVVLMLILGVLGDTTLRRDGEIRKELGLKILGRMPNLGDVHIDGGRVSTMPKINL